MRSTCSWSSCKSFLRHAGSAPCGPLTPAFPIRPLRPRKTGVGAGPDQDATRRGPVCGDRYHHPTNQASDELFGGAGRAPVLTLVGAHASRLLDIVYKHAYTCGMTKEMT